MRLQSVGHRPAVQFGYKLAEQQQYPLSELGKDTFVLRFASAKDEDLQRKGLLPIESFTPRGTIPLPDRLSPDPRFLKQDGGMFHGFVPGWQAESLAGFIRDFDKATDNQFSAVFRGSVLMRRKGDGTYKADPKTFYWKWGESKAEHAKWKTGGEPVEPVATKLYKPLEQRAKKLKPTIISLLERYADTVTTHIDENQGEAFVLNWAFHGKHLDKQKQFSSGLGFHDHEQQYVGVALLTDIEDFEGAQWKTRWKDVPEVDEPLRGQEIEWPAHEQGTLTVINDKHHDHAVMPWNGTSEQALRRGVFQIFQTDEPAWRDWLQKAHDLGGVRLKDVVLEGPIPGDL